MRFDRRLLRRARAARIALAADAVLGVAAALLVLAQAVLLAHIASSAFLGAPLRTLTVPVVLLISVVLARATATSGFEMTGRLAATSVLSQLRLDLVRTRIQFRPAALDGAASAEVATLAVEGAGAMENLFAKYLPQLVLAVVVPLAVLMLAAYIDPVSAALMLLTLPLVPVFMWLIGHVAERRHRERWQALAVLATHFADVVRGLPTLRAFNRGAVQAERMAEVSEEYRRTSLETFRVTFLSGAVLDLAATLGVALIAVTVGVRLINGGILFAPALTVLLLTPELYLPLRNLGAQYHASADGLAAAGRLLALAGERGARARGWAAPPDPRRVPVSLEKVSFTYPARSGRVLESVELDLLPGQMVGLVGPNGAGKSTIAALLLRLIEPEEGRLAVGGVDLAGCDPAAWRSRLAWVPQHPTLYRGTLADNIRLGAPLATDRQTRAAAQRAGAHTFALALPNGYETVVGDGGRPLSAGQRQRIALARAFLRDASLLILDEPTANLDAASADLIGQALDELHGGPTILLIAHEPGLTRRTDRIVTLENGRIADAKPFEPSVRTA